MASKHPKVETFATLSAKVAEYERVLPMMQAQAQQAMMMAAAEKGKYLHVLKLFAAVLAQNSLNGIPTIVMHKSLVDQPDTLNIAREGYPDDKAEVGYTYRLVNDDEMEKLNAPAEPAPSLLDATGNPVASNDGGAVESGRDGGAETDGAPVVEAPKATGGDVRPLLRKEKAKRRK